MGVFEKMVTGKFRLLRKILKDKPVICFNFTVLLSYFNSQCESLLCAHLKMFLWALETQQQKGQTTFDLVELILWGWKVGRKRDTAFNTGTEKTRLSYII